MLTPRAAVTLRPSQSADRVQMDYTGSPNEATLFTDALLPVLLVASAALTAPLSLVLLSFYRRAVVRVMAGRAGASNPATQATAAHAPPAAALEVELLDPAAIARADVPAYERALRSLTSATLVYVVAGFAYAVVLTSPYAVIAEDGVPLPRVLWLLSCYLWPAALAAGMLAAVSWRQRLLVAAVYFAMLFAVAVFGFAVGSSVSGRDLARFWLVTNAPATVLLLAYLHRRVRAVGPLVLAFTAVAVTGCELLLSVVGLSFAAMVLGLALFGVAGWWVLKVLARRYEQRRTSDQALTLDAMWLLFGVVQSFAFGLRGWAWIFTGFLGFAAYKLVAGLGFGFAGLAGQERSGPSLLLLRVFALGARSERLFDALSKRWLRAGSVWMIAGPDLASSAVEPSEFLDYMAGRLSSRFIRGDEDLDRRIRGIERGPDPDGRYRVNAFFCYADTWRQAVKRLAASADAVLMDLRTFSQANQGCLFELQQVLASVPLDRVVFLIDDASDRALLESVLQASWRDLDADSPNRRLATPRARLVHVSEEAVEDAAGIVKLLMARAE
jgi:hypothetical protein